MEAELHQRLFERDESALAEVYDICAGAIYGMALKVTRDRHVAEDVTQEVFVYLWEHPERFDPERGALRSWLCTLAHRRAVDVVRRSESQRRRAEKQAFESGGVAADSNEETVEVDVRVVSEVLAGLPHEQAKAIQLAYFEGKTYRDVAEALGVPEGTAKSRIRLGLQHLRQSTKLRHEVEVIT